MTVMGRWVALRTRERVERGGVVPPREYEVQSSMREAPVREAVMAEGAVKAAISSIGLSWWCCLGKEGRREGSAGQCWRGAGVVWGFVAVLEDVGCGECGIELWI